MSPIIRSSLPAACAVLILAASMPAGAAHDDELHDLEQVLAAFQSASDEMRLMLLAHGFALVDEQYGWEEDCQDAFDAYAKAPYDIRRTQILASRDGCPAMCPSEEAQAELFLRLVGLPGPLKTGAVASACDAAGFTPVFAGDLAPLRAQMSLEEFWVFRAGFDLLRRRLDDIGGERAVALQAAYDEILPEVALQLGLYLPPPELALRLPATTSLRPARATRAVGVTDSAITVDGRAVADIVDGAVAADQIDVRDITPLSEAWAEAPETLLVQMDRDLTAEVLMQVLATAALDGTRQFELAGLSAEGGQAVAQISIPDLSQYLGTTGSGYVPDRPPLNLAVSIDDEGFVVVGSAHVLQPDHEPYTIHLPLEDGAYPYAALTDLLGRVKDEYPDEENVILALGTDVPVHAVMSTLDACRDRSGSDPDRVGGLFPHAVVAVGASPPGDHGSLGLGTRGSGLGGGSGYGTGGGHFGRSSTGPETLPSEPVVLGALSKEAIQEVILEHVTRIRFCYERELKARPNLSGKIVVKFVIAKDGTVSSADIKESTLDLPDMESCVLDVIRQMAFPEPKGGGIVIVSYPFLFRPAE